MTESKIKELIQKEFKKVMKDEVTKYVKSSLKSTDVKRDFNQLIKKGLDEFVKFLYVRKSIWQNEIGK